MMATLMDWYKAFARANPLLENLRPVLVDLLWVDGLAVRDVTLRRPGYWTLHQRFCNTVRVVDNTILTWNEFHAGFNTDGVDSFWNVCIADNVLSAGDDCIAIKAGRDWSGRLVNISTVNVLAEGNPFLV